jgi:hypothetical protein
MKLLNRLRDLRNETINGYNYDTLPVDDQHQDLLGVGTTTTDDILRLNIADTHHANLYRQQD